MCGPKLYEYTCGATQLGDQLSFTTCNKAPPTCKKYVSQPWPVAGRCGKCATCKIVEMGGGVGSSKGSGGYDRTSGSKKKPKVGHQYDTSLSDERLEAAESIEKRRGDEIKPTTRHKPTFRENASEPQSCSKFHQSLSVQNTSLIMDVKSEHEVCTCTNCQESCMLLSYVRCKNRDQKSQNHEPEDSSTTDQESEDEEEEEHHFSEQYTESDEEDSQAGFLEIEEYDSDEEEDDIDDDSYQSAEEHTEGASDDIEIGKHNEGRNQPRPFRCKGKPVGRHYESVFYATLHQNPEDIQKDILSSMDDLFDESNYDNWTREIREMLRDNGASFTIQLKFLKKVDILLQSHNYKAHEFLSAADEVETKKRQTWVAQMHKDLTKENKEKKNGDNHKENANKKEFSLSLCG